MNKESLLAMCKSLYLKFRQSTLLVAFLCVLNSVQAGPNEASLHKEHQRKISLEEKTQIRSLSAKCVNDARAKFIDKKEKFKRLAFKKNKSKKDAFIQKCRAKQLSKYKIK